MKLQRIIFRLLLLSFFGTPFFSPSVGRVSANEKREMKELSKFGFDGRYKGVMSGTITSSGTSLPIRFLSTVSLPVDQITTVSNPLNGNRRYQLYNHTIAGRRGARISGRYFGEVIGGDPANPVVVSGSRVLKIKRKFRNGKPRPPGALKIVDTIREYRKSDGVLLDSWILNGHLR